MLKEEKKKMKVMKKKMTNVEAESTVQFYKKCLLLQVLQKRAHSRLVMDFNPSAGEQEVEVKDASEKRRLAQIAKG